MKYDCKIKHYNIIFIQRILHKHIVILEELKTKDLRKEKEENVNE